MSVSTRDEVHNQFCREPGAGKPHAGICAGVRLARGVSTHQVQLHLLEGFCPSNHNMGKKFVGIVKNVAQ